MYANPTGMLTSVFAVYTGSGAGGIGMLNSGIALDANSRAGGLSWLTSWYGAGTSGH